jgi:perosamine synthetase
VKVPVNRPLLDGNESKYLQECIDTGWISSEGPFVNRFESEFAKKAGREYGVAVSSGTAALDIAIELLDLQVGDEVIIPAFTIISCVHQIMRRGATPVLIDSDPASWNMDTSLIEARITNRTKAILVVHIYGLPVNMAEIERIAKQHKLFVIEDAAEAHGLMFDNRPCGSFGDISIFSFYPNKLITTGEGGMLVTNNHELAAKSQSLRNLCFSQPRYVHEDLGWNYRMTNLQAAIGVAQLERWDEFLARKKAIGAKYTALLSDLKHIQLPVAKTPHSENVYWVYGIVLTNGLTGNQISEQLAKEGIATRSFFCPIHLQPALLKTGLFMEENYPHAENLWEYGLYLPSGVGITDEEIEYVSKCVTNILQ